MKNEKEGIVIEIDNEVAKVKLSRHGDCENCGACPGSEAMILEANNLIGAKRGEHVILEIKENNMLKAAFIVYILPLISIFIGAELGAFLSSTFGKGTYSFQIGGAVIAFLISLAVIVYYEKYNRNNIHRLPKIIRAI